MDALLYPAKTFCVLNAENTHQRLQIADYVHNSRINAQQTSKLTAF